LFAPSLCHRHQSEPRGIAQVASLTRFSTRVRLLTRVSFMSEASNSLRERSATRAAARRRRSPPRRLSLPALALLGAVIAGSRAVAQEPAPAADVEGKVASELAPSRALAAQRTESLSPDEQLVRAKELIGGIEHAAQSVQRDLQAAQNDRDVVRVLCLNDKLNQVDVALRAAQDRMSALGAAVERKDADRSLHNYTVLAVLSDRVRVVVNESGQCVGEETGFIGEADISVSIDPNLPDNDTGFAADTYLVPAPPNISSPIE
jgi:hypothetical protein